MSDGMTVAYRDNECEKAKTQWMIALYHWLDAPSHERRVQLEADAELYKTHISARWGGHDIIDTFPKKLAVNDLARWKLLFERYGIVVTGAHPHYYNLTKEVDFNFQELRERLFCLVEPQFGNSKTYGRV